MKRRAMVVGTAALAAATCLVTACGAVGGSGQSPGPVESASDSGELAYAGVGPCPQGPPASGFLNQVGDPEHDGVVGTVRNETSSTIYMQWDSDICSIGPGQRAAYAGSVDASFKVRNGPERSTSVSVGVYVVDPNTGYPRVNVFSVQMSSSDSDLPCDVSAYKKAVSLSEGSTQEVGGIGAGTLWVHRHGDDKTAARDWTGVNSWAVNDWARIDLMVKPDRICE
jgi:hypothetical protein